MPRVGFEPTIPAYKRSKTVNAVILTSIILRMHRNSETLKYFMCYCHYTWRSVVKQMEDESDMRCTTTATTSSSLTPSDLQSFPYFCVYGIVDAFKPVSAPE
jgi:hypothetical protein